MEFLTIASQEKSGVVYHHIQVEFFLVGFCKAITSHDDNTESIAFVHQFR
jgi:hypothetical protein